MIQTVIETCDLSKYFWFKKGAFSKGIQVKAVEGVNLTVPEGKTTALVGESGSGKTTVGKTIIRIYKPTRGQILFNGNDISKLEGNDLKKLHGQISMVFQDPISSLNPRRKVKEIIADPMVIHGRHKENRMHRVKELLGTVELPEDFLHKRSINLSGGEAQRVAIARSLALDPQMIVLDEPTASLDVSVQAKILILLNELQRNLGLSYLLITHDLTVVRNIAETVYVMYLGKVMESASTDDIFADPLHPYTRCLLSSIPILFEEEKLRNPEVHILKGEIPSATNIPNGCRFHTRCPQRVGAICETREPDMNNPRPKHFVRCHQFA